MLLPRHVPQLRPGRLGGDAGLVAADPIGFGGDERRDLRFRRAQRRHRHAAVGRVDAQVDVLDAFARELEFDAGGGHGAQGLWNQLRGERLAYLPIRGLYTSQLATTNAAFTAKMPPMISRWLGTMNTPHMSMPAL